MATNTGASLCKKMIEKISSVKFARLNPNPTEYKKPMSEFMPFKSDDDSKNQNCPNPKEDQQKPMSEFMPLKAMMTQKTKKQYPSLCCNKR